MHVERSTATPDRLLRLPEVLAVCGLRRSHVYALAARGEFPKPLKLSLRASAWQESAVNRWVADRIAAARGDAS